MILHFYLTKEEARKKAKQLGVTISYGNSEEKIVCLEDIHNIDRLRGMVLTKVHIYFEPRHLDFRKDLKYGYIFNTCLKRALYKVGLEGNVIYHTYGYQTPLWRVLNGEEPGE